MATLRKLLISSKPANYSGCPNDLCADPDCPFDNCSSSTFLQPPSSSNQPSYLSPPVIITMALISAFLILFSYYAIAAVFSHLRRRTPRVRQNAREENESENDQVYVNNPVWLINTVGLRPPVIGAITAVKYRRGDGLIDGTDCAVCLSEFMEHDALRLLPKCSHAFHIACIDTWLRSHTNCPMCRAPIVAGSSNDGELSDENGDLDEESVGSGSRGANDVGETVVDQCEQGKALTSFVDGSGSLRRCVSMGRGTSNVTSCGSMARSCSCGARLSR